MVRIQEGALTIAGLARTVGVGVETIRYYQRRHLLVTPPRRPGSARRYGPQDVARLRFIRSAQAAGFTLVQIAELLALDGSKDRARARALTLARIAELDAKIAALEMARRSLARMARACGEQGSGPCPIIASLVKA